MVNSRSNTNILRVIDTNLHVKTYILQNEALSLSLLPIVMLRVTSQNNNEALQ